MNEEELPIILNLLEIEDSQAISSTKEILQRLAEEYSMKLIALTRGEKGSFLLSGNESSNHSGFQVKVVDTVGAGDAFTAAVVVGLLNKMDPDSINDCQQARSYVYAGRWNTT